MASALGCSLVIIKLIDEGISTHVSDADGPDAALRYACANGNTPTALLLLEAGANPLIHGGLAIKLCQKSKATPARTYLLKKLENVSKQNKIKESLNDSNELTK